MSNTNFDEILSPKIVEELRKRENESDSDYVKRVSMLKVQTPLSWDDFAQAVYLVSGVSRDESIFRKASKVIASSNMQEDVDCNDLSNEITSQILEMRKERCKLSDERTQLNAYIRRMSREDTLQEIAENAAKRIAMSKPLSYEPDYSHLARISEKEALLMISDWHFGLDFENSINKFNPEICKQRVAQLTRETIRRCIENDITSITVLNLSDLIAGRIHSQIRIQSREDVMSQIMDVSEILAEMLTKLSESMSVRYYDCLDNHSRIEPNKNESLDLESLARFIPFYLRARLKGKDIRICDNEFSEDIITCEVCGHQVIGVHGDRDKPLTALDKLTLMTRKSYDLMCTAHLHHFSADEKCGCITIGNGSLMGADDYALRLRLFSKPSQTLIIVSPENVCETIYKINLE